MTSRLGERRRLSVLVEFLGAVVPKFRVTNIIKNFIVTPRSLQTSSSCLTPTVSSSSGTAGCGLGIFLSDL
jgi:hypothetical protein